MGRTATWLVSLAMGPLMISVAALADPTQHAHDDLPPGPIRDRHRLMEGIGQRAEQINNALKAGATGSQVTTIEQAAKAMAGDAQKIPALFPPGSTDSKSRALPAIWQKWSTFEAGATNLEKNATALAASASSGDTRDLKEKARQVFSTCKSCHDQFRKPE